MLHGVGTGAFVKNNVDLAELAACEPSVELVAVKIVREPRAQQIAILRPLGQIIDGNDLIDADGIETLHEIAANKPGSAGHHHSHENSSA